MNKLQTIIHNGLKRVVTWARSDDDLLVILDEVIDQIDDNFFIVDYDPSQSINNQEKR